MTLLPHQACVALKRKPVARGKRAPRAPSIVDVLCRLPWLVSAVGNVALEACHLALMAARAPLGVIREDAQHDSRRATTPDGRAGRRTVEKWPRYGEPAQLSHGGRSD